MILDSPRSSFDRSIWRDFARMQEEMNRLFSAVPAAGAVNFPAVNVWMNAESAVLTSELPGVKLHSLDISVQGDTLTIRGSREATEAGDDLTYHRRERGHGRFSRTFQLPFRVEPDEVSATLRNGLLTLTLPRAHADRPRKIAITNA